MEPNHDSPQKPQQPKKSRKMSRQQILKRYEGCCYFCLEDKYHLLDAHRILPGREGGKYKHWDNMLCLCALCHRKVEHGDIKILGRYNSTNGYKVLHVLEDGEEKWIWPPKKRNEGKV